MLQNQHILILGLGDSGLAMVRWCVLHGAKVTVVDSRLEPPGKAHLQAEGLSVTFKTQPFTAELIEQGDVRAVFKSPGLTPMEVAPVWQAAQARGLWLGTELSLFAYALAQLHTEEKPYQPQVLAITGTNGKTTVTSLTAMLLERAGLKVAVAGNIGPSLLDTLRTRLHDLPEVWVLELSSFQLDGVDNFVPSAACILNLTQDHLDWHEDMHAYGLAKARVWSAVGVLGVLPRNDAQVMALWPTEGTDKKSAARPRVSFGADLPQIHGDFGLSQDNGMTWLVRAAPAEEPTGKRGRLQEELSIQRLMPADALRIRGQHNALNALAALALAGTCCQSLAPLLHGLREYTGEPHRLMPVAMVSDVAYFDDSKGTNVGATVAAINSLGAEHKLVVILGGDGKGQDFAPLLEPVSQFARAVVLIGRDAPLLAQVLQVTGISQVHAQDMNEAVNLAAQYAQTGDAVLLSPACASLDMYANYVARAQAFSEAVHELQLMEGTA